MQETLKNLQAAFNDSEHVWFFVTPNYRIHGYNKTAAANSIHLHKKEITAGDSILDYARDTNNKIDEKFITCFGRSAAGQTVKQKQRIEYDTISLIATSTYTPVYKNEKLMGISILVEVKPE